MSPRIDDNSNIVVLDQAQQSKPLLDVGSKAMEASITPASVSSRAITETDATTEDATSADSVSQDAAFDELEIKNTFLAEFSDYHMDDIEDVYPCTAVQEGILMSQTQETEDYIIRATMELHEVNGSIFDLGRLQKSWDSIVNQSTILRTVFVQSTTGDGVFQQVVLRRVPTKIREIQREALGDITTEKPTWEDGRVAPHCLTFCKSSQGPNGLKLEIHHGVSDAIASMKILHELMRLYDDPSQQLKGVSFSDFVHHLQISSEEEKLKYWQEFLADSQPSMFPKLRIGAPKEPSHRRRRQVLLDREGVWRLVKSSKVSFSLLFHAAWSALLRAYLGKEDVTFGYISSGRYNVPLPEIQEALGTYISMMVARARMDDSTRLADLASQLRQNISNSLKHEHCSLASIQRKIQFNSGLFNTLVDVQRRPRLQRTSEEINLNLIHVHTVAEYDVVLNIEDTGDKLIASLDYKTDHLGEADVGNIISCFTTIIDQFLKDPQCKIKDLNLFSKGHLDQVALWNEAQLPVTNACAHDLFETEAARHPDKLAIRSLDVDFTYGQLSEFSTRLADHLVSLGAGPGVMIPFCMEKSPWAIVSMMAVMKAGAAFVPIDPAAPARRFADMFEDTKATMVIASTSTLPTVEQVRDDRAVILVNQDSITDLRESADAKGTKVVPRPPASPSDTAYVLFTSGSTGKPKGVVVPHRALCSSMYAHGPATGIESTTRALQFGSYTFDSVIAEVFTVLVHGGCVCVPSDEDRMNNVTDFMMQLDVNWAMLTPTFVRGLRPELVPGVHTLVLIGEAVDKDCLDNWLGKVRLFNGYGPTETTVICVARQFPEESETDPTNIGKPVGCRAWVVNPNDQNSLTSIGAIGELVIEGPNITHGYLGDAEKTEKSFIARPSWASLFDTPSSTAFNLYKTGDLVRQLSDGSLKFCGRADSQAKVNGQRLELGEVETHLLSDASTIQVLAEVPKSGPYKGRLVAALCLSGISGLKKQQDNNAMGLIGQDYWHEATQICAHLSDKLYSVLPAYMVPTVWIPVEKMPLLPSGKLDRRQICTWIATIDGETLRIANEFQTSAAEENIGGEELFRENETARQIRKIWSEVLGIQEQAIGSSNAFLSLGGDSISAMRIVSKARAEGYSVTVQNILQHRTIAALVSNLQQKEASSKSFDPQAQPIQSQITSPPENWPNGPDFEFWGVANPTNLPEKTISLGFELDPTTTSALLGTCQSILRTEPVELFIGIVLYAFKTIFNDRDCLTIFAPKYERSQPSVDGSSRLFPVSIYGNKYADISQIIRQVKDTRRTLLQGAHNGEEQGMKEAIFRYRGLNRLQKVDSSPEVEKSEVPWLSLIDISIAIENERLSFLMEWSPNMNHQDGIRNWVETCASIMRDCAYENLLEPLPCLSDYPLLLCDYKTLDACMPKLFPGGNLRRLEEIEDIFPCAPCQEGMIISQIRHPGKNLYNHETTWQVSSASGNAVDIDRLEAACRVIIQRHQILRTVFCETEGQQFPFIQVVFKNAASLKVQVSTSNLPAGNLSIYAPNVLDSTQFPYHLAICNSPDGVSCKFVINHALLDGSCLRVLIQELSLVYDHVSLAPPPLYSNFIHHLLSNPQDESYAYWKSLLRNAGSCHFPRINSSDETEVTAGRLDIVIPRNQTTALRKFSKEHGITIAAVMNTVWALVLRTYIGNDAETICFGYMASGRDVPVHGVHEMMGPLLNMLVQRVDIQPSTTIADLVQSVYDQLVRNLPYQNCSLAKIQSGLELGAQSLFNTLVNVQKVTSAHENDVSPTINWELKGEDGPAEYDIILGIVDSDKDIKADLLFWTSCISEAQAVDLSYTLLQVLSSLVETSSQSSVSEVEVFSEAHARHLLDWNPHSPYLVDSCLHDLFEQQALLYPDAPATSTTGPEGNWTYAQLDDFSTRLAAYLQSCGVKPGMAVPFCFDRSSETIASVLAILKSGGACVALDPSYPIQRLKDIIRMTEARFIVCQNEYSALFENVSDVLIVPVTPQLWDNIPNAKEYTSSVKPSDPAFVNFTSGSTGVPKGNILEHKSIASALWHHRAIDPMDRQTRGLHFASYTFDMSFAEILLVLCSGGCLCIPTEYERLNNLSGTINKLNVNWAYLTPTVASLLNPSEVPSLKTICLGGEPVLDTLVTKWMHEARLIATYGPSECSIAISRSEVKGCGNGQLGPASGGLLWIVDPTDHGKLVPIGAPGELLIEGPLVGRDYLDANLAKNSFIVDPAWTRSFPVPGVPQIGRRMYKTGDIVRFNKDGSMVMLGRKAEDGQAKIHGQRVDLGEVSHHITASGIVKHAVCLVAKEGLFAKRLTAILSSMDLNEAILGSTNQPMTLQNGPETRASILQLRQWLDGRVPGYMIPRSWILLEKIPVTLNGKLNRRELLQWLQSVDDKTYESILSLNNDDETNASSTKALSPIEKSISRAWGYVLNVPETRITANQSFFSLGGDSIAAIQVSSRLLNEGIQISMHDILQYRRLSEIAKRAKVINMLPTNSTIAVDTARNPFELLSRRLSDSQFGGLMDKIMKSLENLGTDMESVEEIFPCSPMQEGILFSRAKQNGLYELVNDFKVVSRSSSESISIERFRLALEQVVARHQSLRSFFIEGDDSTPYVQVVRKTVEPPILCISSPNHQKPFEAMESGYKPLGELGYRFVLCHALDTGDIYGRLEINHALIDGASMKNLIVDIRLAYDDLIPSSHLPPQYGDFINYLERLPSEKSLDHWTSIVQGLSPCILPSLNTATDGQNACKAIDETLSLPSTQSIFDFCKSYDTTIATLFSAAWALVLRAYVGMDTVCFGYLTSGRAIPVSQAESIIGPLITMMVSRVDLHVDTLVLELIRGIHEAFLNGLEHQHTSLSAIQQAFDGGNQRGQMFNTVVNVLKGDLAIAEELPSTIELEVMDAQGPTEYDVSLDVVHTDDSISISFSYWTSCISDEQASLMQKTLLHVLDSLVQGVSGKIGDLEVLGEAHRSRIMEWASSMPSTAQSCVHELVEKVVATQPDKDAIVTSDMSMSYHELDSLASCLASHLASLGVGPEVMVPFCFDKSPWTIVVMYAILKAGGSCVALSPEFPNSRLSNMIEATQATLVICDATYASRLQELASSILSIDLSNLTVTKMFKNFENLSRKHPSRSQPHHPAIIAFTSGSTGTPKGIILTHSSMSTSIFAHGPLVLMSENSRVLQFSSYTFDASLEEIFTTLTFGGTIFVPTEYERMNELPEFMKTHKVNFAALTPTVASLLNPEELPLETVDIAGEMVPQNLASKWAAHTNLVVTYGPAECSIISSGILVDPKHVQNGTLGRPAGTLMWIVDANDHNKLVPIGCAGEILIEGPLLARGYINNSQTENAFIFDPSWTKAFPVPGADQRRRMYKTGDLARYEPDGTIIYLGRMDSQVKIHGQRVDLGEVESTLDHQGVCQSVAMVPKDGHFVKKLVAVFSLTNAPLAAGQPIEVVTEEDAANRIAALRKALQGNIPVYMLPRVWVPVKSLPLNPNGKLDRRMIQRWVESLGEDVCERIFALGTTLKSGSTLSRVEKLLVSVWSEALGIPESMVDIDQPFFSLGGDSVSAIRVASRLRSEGISLAVHDIFRHRTISALAIILRSNAPELEAGVTQDTVTATNSAQTMHFKRNPNDINYLTQTSDILKNVIENCKFQAQVSDLNSIESVHPCSPMQEGILLSTSRSSNIYDAQEFWRVVPKSSSNVVDRTRLQAACESVIARHDILRTHLVEVHHGRAAFLQVVLKQVNPPILVTDLDNLEDLMSQPLPQLHKPGTLPYLFTISKLATGDTYLRLDISHALSDGVSTGVLMRDLLLAYNGQLSPTGPVYRDYISYLESQKTEGQSLQFWKETLKDATPCHFPLLNESQVGSSPVHRTTSVELSAEKKIHIREFCKAHNTTLANFMSAIWALVLPCFVDASSDTATFGYLTSGRDIPLEAADEILGPMITILTRNVNFEPETTVLQLIENMQQDFLEAWPHQHCSLGEIHHALELSGTPLFNTIVNLGNAGGFKKSPAEIPGDIVFLPENVNSHSEYEIAFNILDSDKGFWLTLGYWDRCLSEAHANVLSHTLQAVIASVLENPTQTVSSVTLVDDFHMDMFRTWNANIPEPILDCIHDTFERQVKLQPEAPAVCSTDPKVSLTYQQLDDMANILAEALKGFGVGSESLVPFCMDKSPWTPVAMIAILKAGGACVALDPNQPILRLKGIIEASEATVVLSAPQYKDRFVDVVPHVVAIEEDAFYSSPATARTLQPALERSRADHNSPAFVIFTSGSTGTPKGIVVEHGAFCSSARSHAPILGLKRGTRVLQFASHTYDLSIAETFTTLMVGGCICVPSEYDRLNRLAAAINVMEVDWMFLTPTVAALLQPEQVPLVRTLVLGGEHATQNNFSSWGGRPGICLINSYGPAECSIWTNANVGVKATSDISNLGRRLGCSLWVADPRNHNRLFPMYARGELVIGGPTLARGYLHDLVKTAAAFIQPPSWFGENNRSGERLYKSGDLVHYNLDGSLSIQGRKDTQVKVHGHRIELDDINSNMAGIPLIEHAMTQLPLKGPLKGRLVAVASLQDDKPVSSGQHQALKIINSDQAPNAAVKLGQIRSDLERQLPKHMIPTVWILVEKMPLLTSGKLDKRTVKAWLDDMDDETYNQTKALSASNTASILEPPENELERSLQQVWCEVLKCDPKTIGMTASFLSLGGDSILAMQAVSRARNAGINIFVQDIFRLKTIRKLSEHAGDAGAVDLPTAAPGRFGLLPVKTKQQLNQLMNDCISSLHLDKAGVGIEDIFPCSPMQEGILISQAKSRDRYHVRALFEVLVQSTEQVNVDRLEQAWMKVAQRHQALRSVFVEGAYDDANVLQVVLDRVTVPVLKLECARLEDFIASTEVNEYASGGPPYRFSICKLPSGIVYCHLTITHALDDGSSMRVLLRDVCLAYDDVLTTEEPPLYSNFISYIRRLPKESGLNFWKSYLDGAVPSHFPTLTPHASSEPTEDGIVERWIEGDQASRLLRLCEEHDITIADVFKTSWAIVLASFLGTDSVCFGYLASGRDAPVADVHNIMGPLINMLVFHSHVEKSKTLVQLCKEANDSYLQALPHQHCSLKEIFHAARGSGQSTSLFNTVVNVQKGATKFFVDPEDSNTHRTIDLRSRVFHDPTEYELSIDVQNFESSILILMNYWTSLLSADQANRLTDLVLAVVEHLLDDPLQTVGQLQLCTSSDTKLMSSWNNIPLVEEDRCLHDVIAEQASLRPDSVAIKSDEGSLTFYQLDLMANRLAHHLIELGAGPEVIIPSCFEKSIWAIVAMLAVLKAGAACAALEPAHPLERLKTILKDTQAPFILCSPAQGALAAETGLQAIVVSEDSLNQLPSLTSAPTTGIMPDNKAFIVYTSGSTGTPKGAILEHRNLYASSRGFGTFGMNSESRVAHFSSYAFDVSIGETMLTLTHGGCVCIISEEDRLGDLTAALNRLEATFTQLTPTVLRTLEPSQLPNLKTIVTAGELLTDDIINKWAGKVRLFNSYGPCECAINSTGTELLGAGSRGAVIGRPLQSQLYIINPENDQLLVPVGAVGELVVSGPIVGRGYLNNEERSKEAFIKTPSWAHSSGETVRFYKTGDLARWTSDGSIHYMGRKDVQVKIRGQRIELGEVECQVAEKAGSSFKAVVAAVPSGGILKQRLITLLSLGDQASQKVDGLAIIEDAGLRSNSLEKIAEIREEVKKALPRHMVPGLWIPVHNVPKLPSGKTNRRLINQWLECMDRDLHAELTTSSQAKVIAPSSDMEEMLQRMWGDLLGLDATSISMDQSFFSLGGDSVLAMQLMARCRAENVTVRVRDIFQYTTIAALAPHCVRAARNETRSSIENDFQQAAFAAAQYEDLDFGFDASNIEDVYPSSPMQQSILSIQKTQKNAWFASFIVEATFSPKFGSSDVKDLARSWQNVVNRHAILRTVFKSGKKTGHEYQVVLKDFAAPISYINGTISEDPAVIFNNSPDLPQGEVPHHQVVFAETSEGRIFMQLQISHALYDAVGISVLWHDLQVTYTMTQGDNVTFDSAPAASYRSFISYIHGLPKESAINYWKKRIHGVEPCFFPSLAVASVESSPVSVPPITGSFTSLAIPLNRTSKIRKFCKAQAVTTANLFQAAWAMVLRHFTGSDDVSFGFMLSGRDAPVPEVDSILGPLINLLPCIVKSGTHQSLDYLLSDLQSNYAETLMNQNCSLEDIRMALGTNGPLYNTFLNMQRVTRQAPYLQSKVQFNEVDAFMTDEYAISVYVSDTGDDIFMEMCYWTSILSDENAAMVGHAMLQALDVLFKAKPTDQLSSLVL